MLFSVVLQAAGNLRLDNLSIGAPQPAGSLSFSYDVYNGQVDQAYIRTGAMAWVCYAYGIYMERTGDFARAALGLESMLDFLFSLQSTAADARHNLILVGWGRYQDPGYQYVPGQQTSVSTEHNIDCYFAFDKAARVLPTAALNLLDRGLITPAQYDSLRATATTAATKAERNPRGDSQSALDSGRGRSERPLRAGRVEIGLDTSLALDAAGSWAALFCHEVGDDAKAVECLEFIYETFFLTDQQILKSSEPDSYNQAYEQLTPFDGFKPYADSAGGYSGSPDSVWMEGTWGALAAYLRLSDDDNLQSYFAAHYAGGLDAFLARLVQSMKIVGTTTGDGGLLSFSLAARGLPWEFSVRKTLASTAWFWITATRNDVLFTTVSQAFAGSPFLKVPRGVAAIHPPARRPELDRRARTRGDRRRRLRDRARERRKARGAQGHAQGRLPGHGLVGLRHRGDAGNRIRGAAARFDRLRARVPRPDAQRQDQNLYPRRRWLPNLQRSSAHAGRQPHGRRSDGFAERTRAGTGAAQPESAWKLYDPAQWDAAGTANPTLINPNPLLDVDQFLFYRNEIFAGYLFEFNFQQPVDAKQFLEYEIFRTLGGYLLVLADGRLSPRFFFPPYSLRNLFAFNERNITILPGVERQPIINQVTFRMDYDGSNFETELLFLNAPSLQQFGLAGQHIIESKGMRLVRGGASLAGLTATRIFRRYGGIDPVSGAPNGGAVVLTVQSHFMTLTVEVGDFVYLTHPLLPNFETGRRGIFNRIFEVIEKQPNFTKAR